jgi:hypothetical protein
LFYYHYFANYFYNIKVIGYQMETRQQVQQHQEEQAPVAVRTRTAAGTLLSLKKVVVEESRNSVFQLKATVVDHHQY